MKKIMEEKKRKNVVKINIIYYYQIVNIYIYLFNIQIILIKKMEYLKKKYKVVNYDIKADNKTKKKYTSVLNKRKEIEIRTNLNLFKININSIRKIFNLIREYPEENILFLYEDLSFSLKDSSIINNPVLLNEIGTSYDKEKNKNQIESDPLIQNINNCLFYFYFIAGSILFFHLCLFLFGPNVRKKYF